jgi:hypothetical protein
VECKIKGVRWLFNNPRKKNQSVQQSAYVENYFDYSARITRRKILVYFVFNIVDCGVNCGLSHSGAHHRVLA